MDSHWLEVFDFRHSEYLMHLNDSQSKLLQAQDELVCTMKEAAEK